MAGANAAALAQREERGGGATESEGARRVKKHERCAKAAAKGRKRAQRPPASGRGTQTVRAENMYSRP